MNQEELRNAYKQSKVGFSTELSSVVAETVDFCQAVTKALGEISREEAIEGIKKFFCEKMDNLK